jgi:putative transcriptional regulator
MKRKHADLDADELIQALTDVRDQVAGRRKITMRMTTVALPARVESMRPQKVREIRQKLKVSQAVFARLLNVPVVTEASWEVGRRNPSGAALRLLQIAGQHPEWLQLSSATAVVCEPKAEYKTRSKRS